MLETYHGGCHCGRVRFRIRADLGAIEVDSKEGAYTEFTVRLPRH